jgi:hypothetical protein
MLTRHYSLAALLGLSALAACASTPPQSAPAAASSAYVTGSRIAVPVDARTGAPDADPAQQQVSSQDLELSGQTNTATALRRLVPAVH